MKAIYENINYNAGIRYIISSFIREYDISKANINILFKYGVLSIKEYNKCLLMSKIDREIYIGKMQKENPTITGILQNGIIEYKKKFFIENNLSDNDVLFIKNDAVFLINAIPKKTKFDNIEFLNKNIYTSFISIDKKEFFYYLDKISGIELLEIKGISKSIQSYHENNLIQFIKSVFRSFQTQPIENTIQYINNFINDFVNLRLSKEYYMDFDKSVYKIKKISTNIDGFYTNNISENEKIYIDISYNIRLLYDIQNIATNIYISNNKI